MQPKWIERVKEVYRFHRSKLVSNDKWTVAMTAKALRRAIGPVNEDLLLARWLRTHEKQLETYEYAYQALEFIRKKKKEQEIAELD